MSPEEFERHLVVKGQEIRTYVTTKLPNKTGDIALRFINGNFRAGGYQGNGFQRWKKSKKKSGKTMVKNGDLRADNHYSTGNAVVTLHNNRPYARIHNEGGEIKKEARKATLNFHVQKSGKSRFSRAGRANFQQDVSIKAHTIKIPKRQFMPTNQNDSPVLMKAIQREVSRDIEKIMK